MIYGMALYLYRRHVAGKCIGGHAPSFVSRLVGVGFNQSYEPEELRPGWRKCDCPIYASELNGEFTNRNTERVPWDEAKAVAARWRTVAPRVPSEQAPGGHSASKLENRATITETGTNVYSVAGSSALMVAELPVGSEVEMLTAKKQDGNNWISVTFNDGRIGYMPGNTKVFANGRNLLLENAYAETSLQKSAESGAESPGPSTGVGFLVSDDSQVAGCLIVPLAVLVLVTVVALSVAWGAWHSLALSLISLMVALFIAFLLLRGAVRSGKARNTARKQIRCRGVWMADNEVYAGPMDLDCGVDLSESEFLKQDVTQFVAVRACNLTKTSLDGLSLVIQIVELAQTPGVYRIGRIVISRPAIQSEEFDFLRCNRPTVLLDGQARSCFGVDLRTQIEAIARVIGARNGVKCRIVISPRATGLSGGGAPAGLMYGPVGSLIEGAQGSSKESAVSDALRSDTFINAATSQLLLRLIEGIGWEVEVSAVTSKQLGLVGSQW